MDFISSSNEHHFPGLSYPTAFTSPQHQISHYYEEDLRKENMAVHASDWPSEAEKLLKGEKSAFSLNHRALSDLLENSEIGQRVSDYFAEKRQAESRNHPKTKTRLEGEVEIAGEIPNTGINGSITVKGAREKETQESFLKPDGFEIPAASAAIIASKLDIFPPSMLSTIADAGDEILKLQSERGLSDHILTFQAVKDSLLKSAQGIFDSENENENTFLQSFSITRVHLAFQSQSPDKVINELLNVAENTDCEHGLEKIENAIHVSILAKAYEETASRLEMNLGQSSKQKFTI